MSSVPRVYTVVMILHTYHTSLDTLDTRFVEPSYATNDDISVGENGKEGRHLILRERVELVDGAKHVDKLDHPSTKQVEFSCWRETQRKRERKKDETGKRGRVLLTFRAIITGGYWNY